MSTNPAAYFRDPQACVAQHRRASVQSDIMGQSPPRPKLVPRMISSPCRQSSAHSSPRGVAQGGEYVEVRRVGRFRAFARTMSTTGDCSDVEETSDRELRESSFSNSREKIEIVDKDVDAVPVPNSRSPVMAHKRESVRKVGRFLVVGELKLSNPPLQEGEKGSAKLISLK
ncbi:hypothetical protein AAMO2058_000706200 [Amorphochlora amoebiformis]